MTPRRKASSGRRASARRGRAAGAGRARPAKPAKPAKRTKRAKRRHSPNWGGARPGAGRPAKGPIPSEPHTRRPALSPSHPVRITARVVPAIGRLAGPRAERAIRRALAKAQGRVDFRIVYVELRAGKLELVAEAARALALARGMQGFQIAAARYLNREAGRKGTVFPDRYRMDILRTRAEVRKALRDLAAAPRLVWPHTRLLQDA